MRILFIAPWIPGVRRPRSLQIMQHLQEMHDVAFVGAIWNGQDRAAFEALNVSTKLGIELGRAGGAMRALKALLFSQDSLQQAFVSDPRMEEAVRRVATDFKPDLLFLNVNRSVQFRDVAPDIPAVVDLDEYRSAYFRQLARSSSNILLRLISGIEASRIERCEESLPDKFERILVSSPVDASRHEKVRVLRSTVDEPARSDHERHPSPGSIVFSGRQSYRANEEAVTWFTNRVLPKVVSKTPDAHLSIVGADPPARVRRMAGRSVTVTGTVPDLRLYLENACVSVIPVRHATGVQLKLLEAMSVGLACVVSPVVATGAGIENGVHCLVAESPDEWAGAVSELIENESLRARLAESALQWLRANHSSAATRSVLLREVESAVER